jgi:hypothetical protein
MSTQTYSEGRMSGSVVFYQATIKYRLLIAVSNSTTLCIYVFFRMSLGVYKSFPLILSISTLCVLFYEGFYDALRCVVRF